MAKGKTPARGKSKSKKGGFSFGKLLLVLLILFAVYLLAGFIAPGGKSLLARADALMSTRVLQNSHHALVAKSRAAWRGFTSESGEPEAAENDEAAPAKPVQGFRKPELTPVRNSPAFQPLKPVTDEPAKASPPSAQGQKVIEEKRPSGKVIQRLQTLDKPLSHPTKSDEKALDRIIEQKSSK